MNGGVNCTLQSVSDLNRVTLKFSGAKSFNLDTLNLLKNRNYFSYKVNGPLSVYNPQIKVFSINETDFIFDMTIINTLPSVSIIITNTFFIILFKSHRQRTNNSFALQSLRDSDSLKRKIKI